MTNVTGLNDGAGRAHGVRGRLVEYARLMRLDRPIGIWLLLWPCCRTCIASCRQR